MRVVRCANADEWTRLSRGVLAGVALVAAVVGVAAVQAAPPAATAQPTARQIVDQFQRNEGVFRGYRRNHARGVCVSGQFESSGDAARYSMAGVFAPGQRSAVIGRLSIPGTSPYAWDDGTPIRGMALQLTSADGQQWRTAMNAVPAFPVATPAADYEFMRLQHPDPATGDPDPKPLAAFFATHPRANAFRIWDQTTPPSASYATERYNSLDAFYLVDAHGRKRAVRWSMLPLARDDAPRAPPAAPDFLDTDLARRLARGPVRWRLSITFANPGDPVNDASRAWRGPHRQVIAGMLVIDAMQAQAHGACRNINFNPLVLPMGIEPSNDPLLKFRAEVYAESHRRRVREQHDPSATEKPTGATLQRGH